MNASAEAVPAVKLIRPSADYRYYILVDADGERVTDRSFDSRAQADRYVARNYEAPEEDEDVDVQLDCPVCDGSLFALGSLGRVAHFRCRDCGADHAIDSPAVARAVARAVSGS